MKHIRTTLEVSPARSLIALTGLLLLALPEIARAQDSGLEKHQRRSEWLIGHAGNTTAMTFRTYVNILNEAGDLPSWTPLGPTDFISGQTLDNSVSRLGRVNTLAFHPTAQNVIYAGTPGSSLWKGLLDANGLVEWTPGVSTQQIREYPQLLAVSGIALDPQDPDLIYVLTGDGIGGTSQLPALPSFGVMKSSDGGQTWKPTGLVDLWKAESRVPPFGLKLVMDPCNSKVLFVVANAGIFRTVDGAATWERVETGHFRDFEFRPPSTTCSESTEVMYAASLAMIYRSMDGGQSWKEHRLPLPRSLTAAAAAGLSYVELAVTPAEPDWIYAVVGEVEQGLIGVYRSRDLGEEFTLRSSTPNILGSRIQGDRPGALAFFGGSLAVSPIDAEDVTVGRMNTWRSKDGGSTWCITSFWQPLGYIPFVHADVHALEFKRRETSDGVAYDLYAATDGGVSRAANVFASSSDPTNCGFDWEDVSAGLRITQTYRVCGSPKGDDLIYLGSQDNGTYRLGGHKECHQDRIESEQAACSIANGDGGMCLIHPFDHSIVYLSKQNGRILKATNWGRQIVSVTPPVARTALSQQYLTPMAIDPIDPETIYGCYDDLWKTTDGGSTWQNLSQGSLGNEACEALDLALSKDESHRDIYVAKRQTGARLSLVFWSHDDGKTWEGRTIPEMGRATDFHGGITDIVSSVSNPHRAWVTTLAGDTEADFGVSSFDATSGARRTFKHSLARSDLSIKPEDPLTIVHAGETEGGCDRLFIGTRSGVFYGRCEYSECSEYDECEEVSCQWTPFMEIPVLILDLEIHFDSGLRPTRVLAASYGQGVWKLDDPLSYVEDLSLTEGSNPCGK